MFSKRLPMESAILKLTLKLKIIKHSLFLKSMHTPTQFTNVIFVYYVKQSFYWVILLILYFY